MSHDNVPLVIITAPTQASDDRVKEIHLPYIGPDPNTHSHQNKALKPTLGAFKRGGSFKNGAKRTLDLKQADKSEPLRRSEVNSSYNNVSLLSIEKKIQDETGDNVSLSSRSIFSTESPRDLKGIPSLKQKAYYLGVISQTDGISTQFQNLKASYVAKSEIHDTTLDKSHSNLLAHHRPEGEKKFASKVQSMNQIQSKRSSSLDPKFYHGFRKSYISQTLNDQAESFEVSQAPVQSPQQKTLQIPIGEKAEEEHNVPRPPSKNGAKITKGLNSIMLDHRRPVKATGETSSLIMKTNTDVDNKTLNSLPADNTPYSVVSLATFESHHEVGRLNTDPEWTKHRKLKPNTENYLSTKSHKENYIPSQTDSSMQSSQLDIKIPLKPSMTNINGAKPVRRNTGSNPKSQHSETRASSREDLMRRFNDIVTYTSNPMPQAVNEKNGQNSKLISGKDKENNGKKPLRQHDENKPSTSAPKNKKPAEVAGTDAKILVLKNKIKDSELLRKKNKNHRYEESENMLNGAPLKNKLNEINENRADMEEETKRKLLVMRKIQLYDILIKQKVGKKLSKDAVRLVKAEFDKVSTELGELKAV